MLNEFGSATLPDSDDDDRADFVLFGRLSVGDRDQRMYDTARPNPFIWHRVKTAIYHRRARIS